MNYVAIGAPNVRAQALVAGQVDATTMSLATWVTVQNEKGIKVLVNADDYFNAVPLVNKGNAVTTKVLAEKPEALRRFTAAIIKASRYFAENKRAGSTAWPSSGRTSPGPTWSTCGTSSARRGRSTAR